MFAGGPFGGDWAGIYRWPAVRRIARRKFTAELRHCPVFRRVRLPTDAALRTRTSCDASGNPQELAASDSAACTAACTSEAENDNATAETGAGERNQQPGEPVATQTGDQASASLATLAAALVNLSAADRAKLAAMLLQGDDKASDKSKCKASRN